MNIYKDYTLEELCIEYVRFLELWNIGSLYSNRAEIHEALLEKIGIDGYEHSDETEANRILHNLDKEIGYKIGFEYDDAEIEKMGKILSRKLEKKRETKSGGS